MKHKEHKTMDIQKPKIYRLQIEMTPIQNENLKELMDICGFTTKKELVNNAIETLTWMAEKLQEGREITSYQPEDASVLELRMPFFSNIKRTKKLVKSEEHAESTTEAVAVSG